MRRTNKPVLQNTLFLIAVIKEQKELKKAKKKKPRTKGNV